MARLSRRRRRVFRYEGVRTNAIHRAKDNRLISDESIVKIWKKFTAAAVKATLRILRIIPAALWKGWTLQEILYLIVILQKTSQSKVRSKEVKSEIGGKESQEISRGFLSTFIDTFCPLDIRNC